MIVRDVDRGGYFNMQNMIDIAKTDQVVKAVDDLTRCCQGIDLAYLFIGKTLLNIKENELYKHYSEHTQTMSAFLREIDIGIGMSAADHYIRIYRTFGEKLEGRKIAFKRLLLIHPLVTDEATAEKWLDLAEKLPYNALVAEKREYEGRTPSDACDHPLAHRVEFWRCSVCHQWIKKEG